MSENVYNYEQALKQIDANSQGFDVNAHADETIGPVDVKQVQDSIQASQNGVDTFSVKAPAGNMIKGSIDPNRIQSETDYNILGSNKTKDGTRVYVDNLPRQLMTPEEKQKLANTVGKYSGNIAGTLAGGAAAFAALPVAKVADELPGPGVKEFIKAGLAAGVIATGVGTKDIFDTNSKIAARKVLDYVNPTVPVSKQGNVTYVEMPNPDDLID